MNELTMFNVVFNALCFLWNRRLYVTSSNNDPNAIVPLINALVNGFLGSRMRNQTHSFVWKNFYSFFRNLTIQIELLNVLASNS